MIIVLDGSLPEIQLPLPELRRQGESGFPLHRSEPGIASRRRPRPGAATAPAPRSARPPAPRQRQQRRRLRVESDRSRAGAGQVRKWPPGRGAGRRRRSGRFERGTAPARSAAAAGTRSRSAAEECTASAVGITPPSPCSPSFGSTSLHEAAGVAHRAQQSVTPWRPPRHVAFQSASCSIGHGTDKIGHKMLHSRRGCGMFRIQIVPELLEG
jgi:hypothetical protein